MSVNQKAVQVEKMDQKDHRKGGEAWLRVHFADVNKVYGCAGCIQDKQAKVYWLRLYLQCREMSSVFMKSRQRVRGCRHDQIFSNKYHSRSPQPTILGIFHAPKRPCSPLMHPKRIIASDFTCKRPVSQKGVRSRPNAVSIRSNPNASLCPNLNVSWPSSRLR